MMVLGALKLLLLLSVILYSILGMSVEKTVRVIVELAGEFRSAGVYVRVLAGLRGTSSRRLLEQHSGTTH